MIRMDIPDNLPLTYQDNGVEVVVVVDVNDDNEPCGVYPNGTRALEYIRDWCKQAGHLVTGWTEVYGGFDVEVEGKKSYEIRKTHMRM